MQVSLSPDLAPVPSTLNKSSSAPFQLEARVTSTFNPYEITEESYKTMLIKHKKRRSHTEVRRKEREREKTKRYIHNTYILLSFY
jgi:hypothetical protein